MGVLFPLSRNRTLRPARALLTGALLCSSSVHAQQLDTVEIHLDAITVEDGLPQGYVQAMAQDGTGYLWFGTKDGLARYDGYSFTVFRHNEQDTNSIGGDHISSLLVDREGYLWVGYAPFGLDRYDPSPHGPLRACTGRRLGRRPLIQAAIASLRRRAGPDPDKPAHQPRVAQPGGGPERWGAAGGEGSSQCVTTNGSLVDARVFIGPNDDPQWIANPDTFRCIHRSADGSFQVIDRPHKMSRGAPRTVCVKRRKWWPIPLPDTCSSPNPALSHSGSTIEAAPLDTIHLTDQQFQLFLLLDSQRRIWGGPHNGMDRRRT